jgi:Cu(I)/Ag(I) efflux system membrane fusion protein
MLGIIMKTLFIAIVIVFSTLGSSAYTAETYICPMHPHIQGEEGDNCPICGMDLVLFEDNQTTLPAEDEVAKNAVTLSAALIQTIGVRTATAQRETFSNIVRAVGTLSRNERTEHKITSRAEGWIDQLGTSAIGDDFKAGDLLYKIHSPDMVIAQGDFLRDVKAGRTGRDISSYKVFHHYEMDQKVIQQIKDTKETVNSVPYYARSAGTVTELNVKEGSYVDLNTVLATTQDFSTLWVLVHISEQDLTKVEHGNKAKITLNSGQEISATINHIHPTINVDTRTGRARLEIDNIDGKLRPGAYANVEIFTNEAQRLTVPSSAVLHSSTGARVIIALGKGRFAPADVKTGITNKGKTEIISGIHAGDDVVISSQFLIDSESNLREALQKVTTPSSNGGAHANH